MNWKALLQTFTVGLVGTGLNWGAGALVPALASSKWGPFAVFGLTLAGAYSSKSPWTRQPDATVTPTTPAPAAPAAK